MPGAGPVVMGSNITQVGILNAGGDLYVFDTTAPAGGVVKVTDADYIQSGTFAMFDGFGVFIVKDSDQWFISDRNDLTSFDGDNTARNEKASDRTRAVIADHGELWFLGNKTMEVWVNTGDVFPFARLNGGVIERGIIGPRAVTREDNTIFWMAENRIIYRLDTGYRPAAISTDGINAVLSEMTTVDDCIASAWTEDGHINIGFAFPTEGRMLVYDTTTRLWHERLRGVDPDAGTVYKAAVDQHFGRSLIFDENGSRVLEYRQGVYDDAGAALMFYVTLPPITSENAWIFAKQFELFCQTGVGLNTGQGSDPQIMMQWSEDGVTWSNEHWRSLGKIGKTTPTTVKWPRQGRFRLRMYRLIVTDPVQVSLLQAFIRGGAGSG